MGSLTHTETTYRMFGMKHLELQYNTSGNYLASKCSGIITWQIYLLGKVNNCPQPTALQGAANPQVYHMSLCSFAEGSYIKI